MKQAETQDYIRERMAYWQERLGLQRYRVFVHYVDASELKFEDGSSSYATISAHPRALQAEMNIAIRRSRRDLNRTIRHECLHLLLAELACSFLKLERWLPAETWEHICKDQDDLEEQAVILLERGFEGC